LGTEETRDAGLITEFPVGPEVSVTAGVRIFVGGLQPASSARSLRAQPGGKVLITDRPYLETAEHIGGFWVLEAANLEEALAWGRKAVVACRGAPVSLIKRTCDAARCLSWDAAKSS
jgi:hypothetical protein